MTFTPHYNNDLNQLFSNFQIFKVLSFHVSSSCFIWIRLRPNFWIRNSLTHSLRDARLIEGSSPTRMNLENKYVFLN